MSSCSAVCGGTMCNNCNIGLDRLIQFLDGSNLWCCTYCDYERLVSYRIYVVVGRKKIGCTIERIDIHHWDGSKVIERYMCQKNTDCENCQWFKRRYREKRKFKTYMMKRLKKPIDVASVQKYLDEGREVIHKHHNFGLHPITRKHKKGGKCKKFYNYDEWVEAGKPIQNKGWGFDYETERLKKLF